jgi:hypothetical protein
MKIIFVNIDSHCWTSLLFEQLIKKITSEFISRSYICSSSINEIYHIRPLCSRLLFHIRKVLKTSNTETIICKRRSWSPSRCDSPNPLHFSMGGMVPVSPFQKGYWFIGETDLLVVACYDLFSYLDRNTCMTRRGQGHYRRQVCSFRRCEFCVNRCSHYILSSEGCNRTPN